MLGTCQVLFLVCSLLSSRKQLITWSHSINITQTSLTEQEKITQNYLNLKNHKFDKSHNLLLIFDLHCPISSYHKATMSLETSEQALINSDFRI